MAIKENATVKITGGFYNGKTGKVVNVHSDLDIAIVAIEEVDRLVKIPVAALVEVQPQEKEVETEILEGAKKISRADYDAALIETTIAGIGGRFKNPMTGITGAMSAAVVGEFIGLKIFKDSDVVVMTEDQLILDLWEGCNPRRVNEIVDNDMSLSQAMSVSIAAFMTLRKIPGILFGAENG